MLFLKRILASLIDLGLFVILTIAIDWVLIKLDYQFSNLDIYYIGFIASILFPISIFATTIGHVVLKIYPIEKRTLVITLAHMLKYCFLFFFFSNYFLSIFSFFKSLVSDYTYSELSFYYPLRMLAVLFILNILCFLVSFGAENFWDFILNISYSTKYKTGLKLSGIHVIYLFTGLTIVSTAVEYKLKSKFSFEKTLLEFSTTEKGSFFPHEVFDNYTGGGVVISRIEETNKIVTPSDISSIFLNRYLAQRQIITFIDDRLIYDDIKRLELCTKLVEYSYKGSISINLDQEIMQTKIVLINIRRVNPFACVQAHWVYYFDNKKPVHGIYGGYNVDSLAAFYDNTQESYYNYYMDTLSKVLKIPRDTLEIYRNEDGSFTLNEKYIGLVNDTAIATNFQIKNKSLPVVKYEDVVPIGYLSISTAGGDNISISNILQGFFDSKTQDMYWRKMNYIFSR